MLDVINGFANGWVATPVISSFARHGVFEAMSVRPMTLKKLASRCRGNVGHLRVALRLLYELGWIEWIEPDQYEAAKGAALAQQLPSDLADLIHLSMAQALEVDQPERLLDWLERCGAGWAGADPAVVRVLDGALLAPLLAKLSSLGNHVLEQTQPNEISIGALQAIQALFVQRGWGQVGGAGFRLTPSGQALLASSGALGVVVSYVTMFRGIDDLLFGKAEAVFDADEQGHESHIDRTLNVTASGLQHQSHFAELDTLILRIFDQSPLDNQPRYIADMGCGDGSLLRRIYELVKTRSARGQALTDYPLTLIGADYNALALDATGKTLAGLPHVLVRADIADPQQLIADLAAAGITDPENILHVRSFLDHDRPFLPLEDQRAARRRARMDGTGVYVARDGSEIKVTHAVQGLVEHLRRWRKVISRFGLLVLEVHCLPPATVKRLGALTESAHFDAYHAFSGQQLVEAPIFLAAAAEAGLFPEEGMSQAIPKQMEFTRISLHRLVPQPYMVRHPVRSDLRRLKQLDRICQPQALHTPVAEIKRRVCDLAQEQWVLEFDGQIVAALYTQRIESLEALRASCYQDMARLHWPQGRCVQLLGLFVAPEMQGRGFSDALIGLILAYSATLDEVSAVVGVTRCANFIRCQPACSLDDYIQSRNEQGQLIDPMLHFHISHGAVIHEVLRRFRPEDTDNEGAGILIEYPLRPRGAAVAKTEIQQAVSKRATQVTEQIESAVSRTVLQVLGSQRAAAYGVQIPLMEMGLSSLELLELRMLLGTCLGESLPSTFLFSYGTPEAIMGYFMAQTNAPSALPTTGTSTSISTSDSSRAVPTSQGHASRPASSQSDEAIALIGMACRLPGGINTPAQLWQKLLAAHDLVGQLPASRQALWWGQNELCRWPGGFLSEVAHFDAEFFRISPLEAELLDPQQRCLLEVAWEALEAAAIAPAMLRGTRSGVFVGMMAGDYEGLIAQHGSEADLNAYFATGNACSVAAGRLSYFFDWQGPALSIDTACSSSLVAVHTAYRSLLNRECNLALAAGVNLLLDEKRFLAYEQAGMLSPYGRCRTFDAAADGYVRGEGCAAVILKRLSEAQADGDPIIAVLRGSAINQDGSSSGLTAPNQLAQQTVIEAALTQAKIAPQEIGYLEAHGTGTKLGDPIEVMAAAQVLGVGRSADQPLLIGSLKSAIGHLEAAAGIAGLIKTVLSIQHGVIPAQLHFETPNPHIPWENLPVRVVTHTQAWPAGRKRAGISSFGFSGTNAHLIVEEYVAPHRAPTVLNGPVVVVLSAKNEERLRDQVQQLLAYLECQDGVNLADLAYTLQVGREALGVRLALVVDTIDSLQGRLSRYARGEADQEDMYHGRVNREQAIFPVFRADEEFQETMGKWMARGKVGKLAQLWVQGLEVAWGQLYGQTKPQRISLPTYPFAKERYWVPQKMLQGGAEHPLHPLVHRNTSDLSEQRFSTMLTGAEFFLRDHVVQGERVVPAAAQLEWARAAVMLASGGEVGAAGLSVLLQEVTWLRPLVVVQPQEVQIGLEMQEDDRIHFEIYSGSGNEAVVYSQGWAQLAEVGDTPRVDLEAVRRQCEQVLMGEVCYARFAQLGLSYGPSFQVLSELRVGNTLAVGALRLPGESLTGYEWLPNMLDGALQTSMGLTQSKTDAPLALPFTVAQVRRWGELPTPAWVVVRPGAGDNLAIRKLDVDVVDASGRVALCLSGFSTRPLHDAVDDTLTAAQAVPIAFALPAPVLVGELTLAPVWEEAAEINEVWPFPQQRVALLGNRERAQSAWLTHYPQAQRIALTGAESVETLIERLCCDPQLDHLVWWVPPADALATQQGFKLIKALLSLGYGSRSLGLTVLTQQAQAVWLGEAIDATAAGVHGLMGSLAKEYAHWRVRLLDLPAHEDVPLAWLLGQPADDRGDARAYRHGQGYQQRLVPCTPPVAMRPAYRTGGVYVILGGAGGLGVALSEHLIQHYQAQVVWLGRRVEDATIAQQCARLAAFGPTPLYLQADATDRNALVLAHAMIRERFGAIHGVVHAAIVLADRSLAQMDEATFEAAWSAKVATTEHLTEVFGQETLDWLAFFSSIQSFITQPGQSNYAAGCCFADAFAQELCRQRSYPVKIMNWGYWGSVGVVASAPYRERMAQMGIGSIEPPAAMAVLERLLAGPMAQLAFVKTTQTTVVDVLKSAAHETLMTLPAAPAVVLPQAEVALPKGAAEGITDLERQLAPLLRMQLATLGRLAADTHLSAAYIRWHAHSLRWLETRGWLALKPSDAAECWAQWEAYCTTAQDNAALRAQVQLVDATLRALPAVLRGEMAATEVLFPQGRLDRLEGIYCNHPVADYFNSVLAEQLIAYVQARVQADPQARLRILEIGAGTGGTSAMVFAQLAPYISQIAQYCYTDVSAAFLLHAQQHYAPQVPYLHTQKLDIECDLIAQDFALGHYDVVVAANVLHATRDIRRTLRRTKTLLKENGLLLLNELTDMGLFAHLTFGLLDGWWLAEDRALRIAGTPGLTPSMWQQVLAAEGFETTRFPAEAAHGLGQQIVVTFSNGVVRQPRQAAPLSPANQAAPYLSPANSVVAPVQVMTRASGASARPLPVAATVLDASMSAVGELPAQIEQALTGLISTQLKIARDELERDAPLSEFGFDSITLTGFGNVLNQKYGLSLSPTIFYEYSTIAALAGYLARAHQAVLAPAFAAAVTAQIRPEGGALAAPSPAISRRWRGRVAEATLRDDVSKRNTLKDEPIAVIGMSGCFPQAEDIDALWANLLAERHSIGTLPASRWEHRVAPAICQAGVIENLDEFDPLFFGLSPREAQGMDPQQRLLMLYVYRVIEDAGYSVQSLSGSATALLVGTAAGNGYGNLLLQAGETVAGYSAVGLAGSMGPNRMSYWLNWHGPSEPIDTACSSSLVAVHRALELLRSGQCAQAVVGGVNTLLSLEMHESFTQAGMLSRDGRCKTFSAQADGYVRGEGVGMVFLKPLSAAERAGDHIYGLIKGSATNHGGRANSLTAPNPRAQADLIKAALQQAGVEPGTVSYIEAHGTGTSLGDPIEVQGLKSAFAELAVGLPMGYCGLGSVKSNIGHLELAAGVVGLIKVLLQLQHRTLVKSLHCEELNPLLALEGSPFYVVQQTRAWEALRDQQGRVLPRRAGVSSFGFGGVNAHVIVEEYVGPRRTPTVFNGPVVVVLSARSEEQLRQQMQQLLAYLERQAEVNLADLAYTLQVGREALGVRWALVVDTIDSLQGRLSRYARGEVAQEDMYHGKVNREQAIFPVFRADEEFQETMGKWMARGKVGKLAQLWVQGLEVAWGQLYGQTKPQRISLPTYPFAKERYWVPQKMLQGGAEHQLHPLVHRNTSDLSEQRFSTTLTGEEFFLRDHVVQGERVVPGVAQLEWARAAVALASEGGTAGLSIVLQEVTWLRPLVVAQPQEVHIGLTMQEDGRIGFEIYRGSADEAVIYSQGWAQLAEAGEAPQVNLQSLREHCEQTLTSETCYARFTQLGLAYGPSFQVLSELWLGDDLAVGALRLPGEAAAGYAWLPNVLDGALQASVGLTLGMTDATLALPFAVAQVRQWGELPMPAWAVVRPGAGDSAAMRKLEVDLVDAHGRVVLRLSGFSPRPLHEAAEPAATAPQTILFVGHGAKAAAPQCLRTAGEAPPLPEPATALDADDPAAVSELQSQIEHALTGLISTQLKIAREELERDAPLSEFGFDSVMLTEFGNVLNQKYGLSLSPTIFYEYSTIAALAGYLARAHQAVLAPAFAAAVTAQIHPDGGAVAAPTPAISRRWRGRVAEATLRGDMSRRNPLKDEPIAVIGMSGCFPQAEDIDALWANLLAERHSIGALPASRWEHQVAPAICHAGVIENLDEFDPLFFGISPGEAQGMDPQQRLLMLYVYRAIEDAGYSVQSLSGSATALLVGTVGSGYGQLLAQAGETVAGYSAAGLVGSMGPNRMSYWLNWHGPSEPIDTACSSSLVAVHRALELLRSGQCAQAVVGGINTLLSLEMHESFTQAGMLSRDGRCKTFSAQADGYVRGEGVGMVFLKPLSAAEQAGDHIYGLIKGSATNHGGRANSLTAPNPRAQADLIKAALQQAGVEPGTVSYIEAHGTGTSLGDPIEVQGLKSAFAELAVGLPMGYCGLGSVKSNIGHLELAAGVVGLIKVLLQLQHRTLVKSLHCEELNPLLALEGSPFYVVQQTRAWEALRDQQGRVLPRRAGVSSFGFGGVNAHVIVEEYVGPRRTPTVFNGPVVVVLSARSEEQLLDQAQQLLAYLERQNEVNLADLAYTLQVGREALGLRLALVTESISALKEQLLRYVRGKAASEDTYQGEPRRNQEALALFRDDEGMQKAIEVWIAKGKVSKLAQLWVQGLELDWGQLYGETRPKRISLPTYPFARERYWVPTASLKGGLEGQLHPLVHRHTSSLSREQCFSTTLTGEEFFLRDHVVQGERVVPGVAQLEWARAAVALASEGGTAGLSIVLQEVTWLRPLVVAQPQEVQIGLTMQEDGRIGFEIYRGSADEAVVYSQGWAQLAEAGEAPQVNLALLREHCEQTLTSETCYARFTQLGLGYGPSFQVLSELWLGDDLAVGALRLPGEAAAGYTWVPNVLDGALQASVGLTPGMTDATLALPFAVAQVRQWGELPMPAWAVVRPGAGDSAAMRKLEVDLVDAHGRVALRLSGFSTRPLHDAAKHAATAPQTILLAAHWTAQPAMAQPAALPAYTVHGILLCEVHEDASKTLAELAVAVPAVPCARLTATGTLAQRYTAYAVQLLAWIQKEVAAHPGEALLLQLVVPSEGKGVVLQGLGGLLRSAQQEYRLLACQVVAMEVSVSMPVLMQRLLAEATSPAPMVRFVQGQREVLGFAPLASEETMLPWRDEGVYLITGGLGGLGQVFARAIALQVRQPLLVLTGRSTLKPAQERILQELKAIGARVVYRAVDVSDTAAVSALVAEMVAQYGQLNGVIHSAGVLHDGLLAQKTGETLRQVLVPKVAGLVALDEATRDVELDWLVLCSSVAGVWGNLGQADYAAANGFLDSYAQYRADLVAQGQRRGQTVSVSWPLWAEGGMQIGAVVQERLRRETGLEAMPSAAGMAALYQALAQPAAHLVVGYGAKALVLQRMRAACETPLLPATTVVLGTDAPAPVSELQSQIEYALTGLVSAQLKIAREELERDTPLSEFGFDSITQIAFGSALHQKYNLDLSPTIFFEYPTIAALAEYLAREYQVVLAPAFAATAAIRLDHHTVSQPFTPPRRQRRMAAVIGSKRDEFFS